MNCQHDTNSFYHNIAFSLYANPSSRGKRFTPCNKALEIYKAIIEIPTVAGRGKVPEMAAYLAKEFREVGFKDEDIRIIPSGETVGMIVRYQGDGTIDKPILLLGHMDVVEALDKDWERPPFELTQDDKYFYGRGSIDNKLGITMLSSTLCV
jgi:carboxypeptidase PM20D1